MSENLDRFKFRIFNKQKNIIQYLGTRPRNIGNEFYMQIECTGISCIDADGLITEFVLMQCTGLRDRNGKLIYEGDILKIGEYTRQVIFKNGAFKFKDSVCAFMTYLEYSVIIGNIYENPELIK
jgi:uncharacterized phage protein (TIGR01671 family)